MRKLLIMTGILALGACSTSPIPRYCNLGQTAEGDCYIDSESRDSDDGEPRTTTVEFGPGEGIFF